MEKSLKEKPCLYLMKTKYQPAIPSEPPVREQRPKVECLVTCEEKCPKRKNKRDLSAQCFRIMRHEPRGKPGGS